MALVNTPRYLQSEEADRLCWYCGVPLTEHTGGKPVASARTQDHVFPLAKGGTSMAHNKVPCCYRCNQWKGMRELEEFREIARPGEGELRLFWGEIREAELEARGVVSRPKHERNKPFNDVLAKKLAAALGE